MVEPLTDDEVHGLWDKANFDDCMKDPKARWRCCMEKKMFRRLLTEYGALRAEHKANEKRGGE